MNRNIGRALYWDVNTHSGHASYGASWLTLRRPPTLHGAPVEAIDYSPLVQLWSVMDAHTTRWRELTVAERDDIDARLERMVRDGLAVWESSIDTTRPPGGAGGAA